MPVWRMIKGYLAACAIVAVIAATLTAIAIAVTESDSQIVLAIVTMLLGVPMGFVVASIAALPGAIIIVVIAHIGGFDSRAYYAAGGALNGLLVTLRVVLVGNSENGSFSATDITTYALLAASVLAGCMAGVIYWHIAVRTFKMENGVLPKPKDWGTA